MSACSKLIQRSWSNTWIHLGWNLCLELPWWAFRVFAKSCVMIIGSRKGLNQHSWNSDSIKIWWIGIIMWGFNVFWWIWLHLRDVEFMDVPCVVHSNWWLGIQKNICATGGSERRAGGWGKSSCWNCFWIERTVGTVYAHILTLTVLPFLVAYVVVTSKKLLQSKKNLGTWNWGEARLSKIEADLQQSLKATGGGWKPSKDFDRSRAKVRSKVRNKAGQNFLQCLLAKLGWLCWPWFFLGVFFVIREFYYIISHHSIKKYPPCKHLFVFRVSPEFCSWPVVARWLGFHFLGKEVARGNFFHVMIWSHPLFFSKKKLGWKTIKQPGTENGAPLWWLQKSIVLRGLTFKK